MVKICKKAFSRKEQVNIHIKAVHLNIKDHKCDICGKPFSEKSTVKPTYQPTQDPHISYFNQAMALCKAEKRVGNH